MISLSARFLGRLETEIDDIELTPAGDLEGHPAIGANPHPRTGSAVLGLAASSTALIGGMPLYDQLSANVRAFLDHRFPRIDQQLRFDRRQLTNRKANLLQAASAMSFHRLAAGPIDFECDTHLVHRRSIAIHETRCGNPVAIAIGIAIAIETVAP